MRAIQRSDKGIGDLKTLIHVRPEAAVARRFDVDRDRFRKINGLIVAVLSISGVHYVALRIIYAARPAQIARGKWTIDGLPPSCCS